MSDENWDKISIFLRKIKWKKENGGLKIKLRFGWNAFLCKSTDLESNNQYHNYY